jgi:hypothetical protein
MKWNLGSTPLLRFGFDSQQLCNSMRARAEADARVCDLAAHYFASE